MNLDVAIVGSVHGLWELKQEWEELFEEAERATPFQSWAWISGWWEAYGEPRRVRIITVRGGGRLVGVLPLMLDRRLGRSRVQFMGTGLSDHLDGLAVPGLEDEVAAAWARGLRGFGGWSWADLQEVPPSAVARRLVDGWSLSVRTPQSVCLYRSTASWEDVLADLSRNARSQARRTLRAAERDGVAMRAVRGDRVPEAVDALVVGHRAQWAERDALIAREHLTDRFLGFLRAAVTEMVARDEAVLLEFYVGQEVLARVLFVVGHDYVGEYMYSATPTAMETYNVTTLWVHAAIELALLRKVASVDLLRGAEPYKRRWTSDEYWTHRLVLGRWSPSWAVMAAYHVARSKMVTYVKSGAAPAWLGPTLNRLRGVA